MNLRAISRTVVGGYLRLVRFPLDTAIALLPGNGTGTGTTASLALDRFEASARAVAGALLGDPEMTEDARRRAVAADKRRRAVELRVEAEERSQRADARLAEREAQAASQREQARRRAGSERQRAEQGRAAKTRRAAKNEEERRTARRRAASRTAKALEDRGRKVRLDTLDAEARSLRDQNDALTARDEARRVREAAGRAKAKRKRG